MKEQERVVAIPERLPGLRWITAIWIVYGLVWIALEGTLWRVVVMAGGAVIILAGYRVERQWGGHQFAGWGWLGRTAVLGVLVGLGTALLTLFFMAVKTGLHAHGPEFSPAEIEWVVRQAPLWAAAGGLAGLGAGLVLAGVTKA